MKERHPRVKGENVTNTHRYFGNGARYDATNSLALASYKSEGVRCLQCSASASITLLYTLYAKATYNFSDLILEKMLFTVVFFLFPLFFKLEYSWFIS